MMDKDRAIKLVDAIGDLIADMLDDYHSDNEFRGCNTYLLKEKIVDLLVEVE